INYFHARVCWQPWMASSSRRLAPRRTSQGLAITMHSPSSLIRRLPDWSLQLCVLLRFAFVHTQGHAGALLLDSPATDQPLGTHTRFLKEQQGQLTLNEARAALASDAAKTGRKPVLSFGMGSQPVWIHLTATNPLDTDEVRRLTLANSWLDSIDLYFVKGDRVV